MSQKIGISRNNYSGYENNSRNYYPAEIIDKLTNLYKIFIYILLGEYNTFLYNGHRTADEVSLNIAYR